VTGPASSQRLWLERLSMLKQDRAVVGGRWSVVSGQ
jgi:hypothetical protein